MQLGAFHRVGERLDESGRRRRLALLQHVAHLLLVGDDAGEADAEIDVEEIAALDDRVVRVVQRDDLAVTEALQVEARRES